MRGSAKGPGYTPRRMRSPHPLFRFATVLFAVSCPFLGSCSGSSDERSADEAPGGVEQPRRASEALDGPPTGPSEQVLGALEPTVAERVRAALERTKDAPDDLQAWSELAMVYHANRLYRFAVEVYDHVARSERDRAAASAGKTLYRRGLCLVELGDIEEARSDVAAAVELAPSAAVPPWRLGMLDIELGRLEEARASFERAIDRNAGFVPAWVGLARVHLQADRNEDALAVLRKVLAEAPRNRHALALERTARLQAGLPESESGRFRSASFEPQAYDPWEDEVLTRRVETPLARAIRFLSRGRAERAVTILEREHEADPTDHMVLLNLVEAYGALGRTQDEQRALSSGLERDPNQLRFLLGLADLYEDQDQLDLALEQLQRAATVAGPRAEVQRRLSRVQAKRGEPEEAVAALREALRLDGRDPRQWSRLGQLELARGNHEGALAAFEEAARFPAPSIRTLTGLARAALETGALARAREALTLAAQHPGAREEELSELQAAFASAVRSTKE